jgi:hypothetical protein
MSPLPACNQRNMCPLVRLERRNKWGRFESPNRIKLNSQSGQQEIGTEVPGPIFRLFHAQEKFPNAVPSERR